MTESIEIWKYQLNDCAVLEQVDTMPLGPEEHSSSGGLNLRGSVAVTKISAKSHKLQQSYSKPNILQGHGCPMQSQITLRSLLSQLKFLLIYDMMIETYFVPESSRIWRASSQASCQGDRRRSQSTCSSWMPLMESMRTQNQNKNKKLNASWKDEQSLINVN